MTDRVVRVILSANVQQYKQAMSEAESSTKKVSTVGETLKKGLAFAGIAGGAAAVAAGLKTVMSAGLDLDRQLNTIKAVSGATASQIAQVSDTAKQLGNDIKLPGQSAATASQAMAELAKGGLSVDQAMQAARGTLQLASAAQIDGGQAATIQANALNTFSLKADEAGHVADLLANAANKSSGEISDFAQALAQGGLVADQAGISIDDTVTALAMFAQAGLKGSDAGTSLKTALLALQTPTQQQQAALDQLGVKVYDSSGKFEGLRNLSGQLGDAQKRMSQEAFNAAAGIAFGSDAVRTAAVLAKNGTTGWDEYSAAMRETGSAAKLAATNAEGLPGKMSDLQNSLENLGLTIYQRLSPAVGAAMDGLSGLFGVAGDLVGVIGSIPGPVYAAVAAFVALKLAAKAAWFTGFRNSFRGFGEEMAVQARLAEMSGQKLSKVGAAAATAQARWGGLAKTIGTGAAFVGAGFVIDALGQSFENSKPKVVDFSTAVDASTGKLNDSAAAALAAAGAFDVVGKAGVSAAAYLRGLNGDGADTTAVWQQLMRAQADAFDSGDIGRIYDTTRALGQYKADLQGVADQQRHNQQVDEANAAATEKSADALQAKADAEDRGLTKTLAMASATGDSATAMGVMAGQTESAARAVERIIDPTSAAAAALKLQADAASDSNDELRYLQQTLDAMSGKEQSLKEATRDSEKAMRDVVKSHRDRQQALADESDARDKLNKLQNTALEQDETQPQRDAKIAQAKRDLADATDKVADAKSSEKDQDQKAFDAATALVNATVDSTRAKQGEKAAVEAGVQVMQQQRDAYIAAKVQAGYTAAEAGRLADAIGLIPKNTRLVLESNANSVITNLDTLAQRIATLPSGKTITIYYNQVNSGGAAHSGEGYSTGIYTGGLLTRGGVRRFASGGFPFSKAPTPASAIEDNLLALGPDGKPLKFRPDEFIVNPEGSRKNERALWFINSGGVIPGFASGGLPGAGAIAGIGARQLGAREGVSVAALGDLAAWVKDLGEAARDAGAKARDAAGKLRDASKARADEIARVKADNAERLKRLAEDNSRRLQGVSDEKRRAQIAADNAKRTARAEQDAAKRLAATTAVQDRKVAAAQREADVTAKAARAAKSKADNESKLWQATARARSVVVGLTQSYDRNVAKAEQLKDRLADLTGQRDQMASGIASSVKGFGGGIFGSAEFQGTSTTTKDIISALRGGNAQASKFQAAVSAAAGKGIDPKVLAELANDATGRGGMVISALAAGSKSDASQINKLLQARGSIGAQVGAKVGDLNFGSQIHSVQSQLAATRRTISLDDAALKKIGTAVASASRTALQGTRMSLDIAGKRVDAVIAAVVRSEVGAQVRAQQGRR